MLQVSPALAQDIAYIPLTQGKTALVDAQYYDWLNQHRWSAVRTSYKGKWYAYHTPLGGSKQVYMHRALAMRAGRIETLISHYNGNTLDNRVANLVKTRHLPVMAPSLDATPEEYFSLDDPITIKAKPFIYNGAIPISKLTFPDLTNKDFGKLWVIGLKEAGSRSPKDLWLCACNCGNQARFCIPGTYLREHETWSCGCTGAGCSDKPQLFVEGQVVRL